jgi:hypothetical protein
MVMNVEAVARRVLAEFEEMPGMALTVPQASRLFGLDDAACRTVVDQLVGRSYLKWTRPGVIGRVEPS